MVELVSRRVYDKLSIRPSNEQIFAVLSDQPVPPVAPPVSEQSSRQVVSEETNNRSASSPVVQTMEIMLWGSRHSVGSYADVLRTVAEGLYERHADDFDKLLELKGNIHPFVARTPQALRRPDRSSEVASSGYFIDTNLRAEQSVKRAKRFLECFGYPPSDLKVLSDKQSVPSPAAQSDLKVLSDKQSVPSPAAQSIEIMLWGSRHSVGSYVDLLRKVAEGLYERHADDFDKLLRLKGKIYPFVARTPQALQRAERSSEIASSGYFIDTNLRAKQSLNRAKIFLECFGYPPSDLEVLSDTSPHLRFP